MKHLLHYILNILLFSFLTSLAAWGQEQTVTIDLSQDQHKGGYNITESSKTYIITGKYKGTPTQTAKDAYKAVISVNKDVTATIILQDVTIKFNPTDDSYIPFYFSNAGEIILQPEGKNVLSGGTDNPAVCVPSAGTLIIKNKDTDKEGVLEATGGTHAPGIGAQYHDYNYDGKIDIRGGKITATGSGNAPGIGYPDAVNATGGSITISGGTVIANNGGGHSGASISGGTFSTGNDGHACIVSNGIRDASGKDNWQGIIFEKNLGFVYGTSVTLSTDAEVPSGCTLANREELIVSAGTTFTNAGTIQNKGTIRIQNSGKLQNDGEILNDSTLDDQTTGEGTGIAGNKPRHYVTYIPGYADNPNQTDHVPEGEKLVPPSYRKPFHTFSFWREESLTGPEIDAITKPVTIIAIWNANEVKLVNNVPVLQGTVGQEITPYDLSKLVADDDDSGPKTYTFGEEGYGLRIDNSYIKGTPSQSTPGGSKVAITVTAANNTFNTYNLPISILPAYAIFLPPNPVGYSLLKPEGGSFSAADLQVRQGSDFAFKLQLEPDYDKSTPRVEVGVNGATTILTAGPDGIYTVSGIQAATTIRVSGVIKSPPPAPEPEPEPEPKPEPTPVYYTVTLSQVEGAATDPVPGHYGVEAWDTFRFYLTLDSAYNQSVPVVTTSRSETITPRTSDGAYLVKYVRSDVEVFIDGIVKNPAPVTNETIRPADNDAPQIRTEGGWLCIRLPENAATTNASPINPVRARVLTPDGRTVCYFCLTLGLNRRQLPSGLYIVQVGKTVRKVLIK